MPDETTRELSQEIVLEDVISTAVKLPGVKVNRNKFLAEQFADSDINIQDIIEFGPVQAGISRENLSSAANKLIIRRTSESSIASFVAGIPGGLAMAATIPADVAQFFGMALRLAQELAYMYGAENIWIDGQVDDERIKSQLILYCGVMFGVSGAVSGVRVLSTQIAKTTLKKLPQKALTKTFWYPIVKQIGKAIGVKVTKATVAQGLSKAVPVVGGVISGSLNFASMMPMAKRLYVTLDKAAFDYSDEDLKSDIDIVERVSNGDIIIDTEPSKAEEAKDIVLGSIKSVGSKASGFIDKLSKKHEQEKTEEAVAEKPDPIEEIKKYKELLDLGIISQEEFDHKKKELLNL